MTNKDSSDSPYITFEIENSFLIGTYKKGVIIDLEIAKRIMQQRLSFQNGNNYLILADARSIKSVSKEARDYFAIRDDGIIALAVLGENSISNIIINMFITFSKPRMVTRAFTNKENALKWLSQFKTNS